MAWKTLEPVIGDTGMAIMPNTTLDECPQLDVICVPGGPGVNPLLNDDAVLGFLSRQASQAQFITSVCTGALVLHPGDCAIDDIVVRKVAAIPARVR